MKHIILFCYIITILIGASALTIQLLSHRVNINNTYKKVNLFMCVLMVMNGFDFFIYYNDNIMNEFNRITLVSLGDCIIALLVFLWLAIGSYFVGETTINRIAKIAKFYVIAYCLIWVGTYFFVDNTRWIRVIIDVPLLAFLLVGSFLTIQKSFKKKFPVGVRVYLIVVTVFMVINYSSYFIQESGLYNQISFITEHNLNATIFYWFVINLANAIFLYKQGFALLVGGESAESEEVRLENAISSLADIYSLTRRESELIKKIYDGKTNNQIAEELFISESTVKAHIYNIFKKFGVKNRVDVICKIRDAENLK